MSGPTTVIFSAEPVTAILAAAAIRAGRAVQQAQAMADEAHDQQRQAAADRAQQLRAAQASGSAALADEMQAAEIRLAQVLDWMSGQAELAKMVPTIRHWQPARPPATDVPALAAYVRSLQVLADDWEAAVRTEWARQAQLTAQDALSFTTPDIPESLETGIPSGSSATVGAHPERQLEHLVAPVVQRLLQRIAHLGPPPTAMAELVQEIETTARSATASQRLQLLIQELRHQIQAHLEATQQAQLAQAQATILEQSLLDLGYQVEEIGDTLFVEGGAVHFRKAGWGDYLVRMRVDAQSGSSNFNVVKAVDTNPPLGAQTGSQDCSVLDHLAEDRWCAEFPALLNALSQQGLPMQVTRRLSAGELPVQSVPRSRLPEFVQEPEEQQSSAPLQARELP